MKLLPKALEAIPPPLHSTDKTPVDFKVGVVKFFFPMGRATWYVVEGNREGDDVLFFGFVRSPLGPDYDEWRYFCLSELETIQVHGLGVERDLHWTPKAMGEI